MEVRGNRLAQGPPRVNLGLVLGISELALCELLMYCHLVRAEGSFL